MQAVVRPMVTRLLLGSFRRPILSALGSTSGGGDLRHHLASLLHRSPVLFLALPCMSTLVYS
jgi:hypothetical protein